MSERSRALIVLTLAIAIAGRAALLQYTDLVDPTEARYASIAQEMVSSGNWLTPMLDMPAGSIPYLGKPPLHFWLTSISYKFFGVDEWTSRLPSFLATILIMLGVFQFSRMLFSAREGIAAVLIFLSSGVPFFMAGASVTDVTLSMLVTTSVMSFYLYLTNKSQRAALLPLSSICAGLAFLAKGPVGLVLIGLPFFLWSLLRRDFSWVKEVRWSKTILLFLAVTTPWFILSEIQNPGFLKYFFWNENIARYLFKSYGDKYGSGHVHAYGMSWLMLIGAFFPWAIALPYFAIRTGLTSWRQLARENPAILFLATWSFATPLFFTFVRQLHILYILPAIPAISILLAALLLRDAVLLEKIKNSILSHRFTCMVVGCVCLVGAIGAILSFSSHALLLGIPIIFVVVLMLSFIKLDDLNLQVISRVSFSLMSVYLAAITSFTSFVNINNSSATMLRAIAKDNECIDSQLPRQVGISTKNTFSPYWVTHAWQGELSKQLEVQYVSPKHASSSGVCYYLLKGKSLDDVPKEIHDSFRLILWSGNWLAFVRTNAAGVS